MRKFQRCQLSILFLGLLIFGCTVSKNDTSESIVLSGKDLHPFGRALLNENKELELISSAAHIGFSFMGTSCQLHAYINDANGHNYLQYELDGVYQERIKVSGESQQPFVITAVDDGPHTVWIYKATEAHTGPVFITKIEGQGLKSLKRPDAPLIEFIGNSITCGAAADPSEVPCGTGVYHDQHNAYLAYGPRVARAVNANFILSSVSGFGIYRNWNSDGPTLPEVYEKADFQHDSQRYWDFKMYEPDVVSIALGTNDFSNGDGKNERLPFDSAAFVSTYIKFVALVKAKYPASQVALLSSPMVNGDRRVKLQNCIAAVKQNIDASLPSEKPIAVFFFQPMEASGCTGHPNIDDHALLAKEVTPFFNGLLNQ